MKYVITFVIAIILLSPTLYLQAEDKTIITDGFQYIYNGRPLDFKQMLKLMEKDSEEYEFN